MEAPFIKKSGGGILSWSSLKRQIQGHLHEGDVYVTMFIDYYGVKDSYLFPGWQASKDIVDKVMRIHFLCDQMKLESTAPSKRLIVAIPSYDKVLTGNCIALDIGLDTIRKNCPLFDEWIRKLETIPG